MAKNDAIIGHEFQQQELLNDLATGNIAHAYLFEGPPHVGKMTVARWFAAKLLLKDAPEAEHGRLQESIGRLLHPDLLVLDQLWMEETCEDWNVIARTSNMPQDHRSRTGAKTDVISIDDVRILSDRLHETGTGTYRCCLIRSIERMQDPAANALLKILEEPPAGRVFLLTTQALSSLLPTITSRVRVLHFSALSQANMRPFLEGVPDDDAHFLLHIAQGAPGLAVRLRDDPDLLRSERMLHGKAIAFWTSETLSARIKCLTPLEERGRESTQFLLHLALALRETPKAVSHGESALRNLVAGFETNANRGLLLQQFAMNAG